MMSQIYQHGLIEAIVHMVNRDFEGLARDYIKLEFFNTRYRSEHLLSQRSVVYSATP